MALVPLTGHDRHGGEGDAGADGQVAGDVGGMGTVAGQPPGDDGHQEGLDAGKQDGAVGGGHGLEAGIDQDAVADAAEGGQGPQARIPPDRSGQAPGEEGEEQAGGAQAQGQDVVGGEAALAAQAGDQDEARPDGDGASGGQVAGAMGGGHGGLLGLG